MPPLLVEARTFEAHLDWIARRYRFVTLDDVADWAEGARTFERPVAAITFDDGYADVYRNALPILRRKGIPAAVFVVTDLVGGSRLLVHDETYLLMASAHAQWRDPPRELLELLRALELPAPILDRVRAVADDPLRSVWVLLELLSRPAVDRLLAMLRGATRVSEEAVDEQRVMDWATLRQLSGQGITIGAHSRTHARLSNEGWERLLDETRGSRSVAERNLATRVEHFAYPGGGFNPLVLRAVAEAGYRCAYTSCTHHDPRHPALTLPRRLFWENTCLGAFGHFSPTLMSCQVSGVLDWASPCRQPH
jgi:peptidoglycan/xylan/chitin deacetylase (PgdA/CDA1 family)